MKNFIFNLFINFASFLYERIFHEKMGNNIRNFLKNIFYVGFGTIIATIFSFTFNILAGRLLGPSGYGEFTLVQSIATFLCIPMLLGFGNAMVKYNSEKEDLRRQRSIISTTYALVFIFMTCSIVFYYFFSTEISRVFSVSLEVFYLSVVFAVFFVFYTFTTNTLRGLHDMKKFAIFRPVFSIILLSVFLGFFVYNFITIKSMVFSMCIAYGVTGGIILASIRKYFRFTFSKTWASRLTRYSVWALIGGASAVFYSNIDKILINIYLTKADIGIYWAYNYSLIMFLMSLLWIFETVFFPFASKQTNKNNIYKKINKLVPYVIILGLPLTIGPGFIIFRLYGGEYLFDLKIAFLFGIVGICLCVNRLYGLLMSSIGIKGRRIVTFAAIILAIANIALNIWLIPLIGIEGAVIATILSYFLSIGIILSKRKYLYNSEVIQY
ncbi:membrane protein involved in the export of O-antigen and teichoic acid [Thermoplasmatales archaeon SCGC AB-539-N05]|nr:membrane protein involved in the export of O-antigen and teichoic acid [Thermoplasmatales archaeon SCGC AB-539-N05]